MRSLKRKISERIQLCPPDTSPDKGIPIVSLFCGAGGLDLGFTQAGFMPVLAVDNDPAACRTFKYNHPQSQVLKRDLATAPRRYIVDRLSELPNEVSPIGVIGGPPCQAFSVGNVHKKDNDPRSLLPSHYAVHLAVLRKEFDIDFFVFENVLGLGSKNHEAIFGELKDLFEKAGFTIQEEVLDAQDFSVPQRRRRIFVVGFNKKKHNPPLFSFPKAIEQPRKTVRDAISSIPDPIFFARDLKPVQIPFHPNHWCMSPRSSKFFNGDLRRSGNDNKGRPFRVLEWNSPSPTVAYGHREVHVHPSGKRRLSVYEAMLLQGFPHEYTLCGNLSQQIRLVSDAVPPPVGKALAEEIRKALYESVNEK
jgi:DNA (cytosine-5)-methyltransferase 1